MGGGIVRRPVIQRIPEISKIKQLTGSEPALGD